MVAQADFPPVSTNSTRRLAIGRLGFGRRGASMGLAGVHYQNDAIADAISMAPMNDLPLDGPCWAWGEERRVGLAIAGLLAEVSRVNISALAAFHREDASAMALSYAQRSRRSCGHSLLLTHHEDVRFWDRALPHSGCRLAMQSQRPH